MVFRPYAENSLVESVGRSAKFFFCIIPSLFRLCPYGMWFILALLSTILKKNGSLIREIIPKLPHFHWFKKENCSKENRLSDSPTLKVRHLLGSVGEREQDIILRAAYREHKV